MSDWLKELKVGDRVVISLGEGFYGPQDQAEFNKIIFVREDFVIADDGNRYSTTNGYDHFGVSCGRLIGVGDEALAEENERREIVRLRHKISSWFKNPSLATLRAIAALIEEGE